MEPIARFVATLSAGGIDLPRAQSILRERVGEYPDDVVTRWLSGDILPGLSIRGHLFEAATSDFEEISWESRTFMGELPESLRPKTRELCEAARQGDEPRLARALGGGVAIDGWDDGCDYPLGYAAERGHRSVAATLLRLGAEPFTFAKGKNNAFVRMLERGDAEMLRDFLTLAPRRASGDAADLSALLVVAGSEADNPEMIRTLAELGRFNPSAYGLAHAEAVKGGRVLSAAALVELGAPVSYSESGADTPSWLDPEGVPVMFVFNRGFGLGFDPRMLDTPILYGGDFDGIRHLSGAFMDSELTRKELERSHASWFMGFVDKLARREDFTLEDLYRASRSHGQEPRSRPDIKPR